MKRIYLDYASTTPVYPAVLRAMEPYFSAKFGNPGSLHSFGQAAIAAIDESRETIARAIGADFNEIIFTGSATEANNLALRGVVKIFGNHRASALRKQNNFSPEKKFSSPSARHFAKGENQTGAPARCSSGPSAFDQKFFRPRIVISAIEHESVLETARDLERDGIEVIYIPVNCEGVIDLKKFKAALNENTVLVSVMYANNEVGTVEPISKISEVIRNFREGLGYRVKGLGGKLYPTPRTPYPALHTDAAQAFQYLDCDVSGLGVDLMTLSAHKIYGPKGVAALYVRRNANSKPETLNSKQTQNSKFNPFDKLRIDAEQSQSINPLNKLRIDAEQSQSIKNQNFGNNFIAPITTGGGQEFGLRSGTENVPLVVGFAKAVEMALKSREKEAMRVAKLCDHLWDGIRKIYPKAEINGVPSGEGRLPNNLNIYLPGIYSQFFLTKLDLAGVAVSSGSACQARTLTPSYVIAALGFHGERAKQSIRFSLGHPTKKADIDKTLKILSKII